MSRPLSGWDLERMLMIRFNKRESDFENMREYDDYLENVENWSMTSCLTS